MLAVAQINKVAVHKDNAFALELAQETLAVALTVVQRENANLFYNFKEINFLR